MSETKRIPVQQNGKIDFCEFIDADEIQAMTDIFVQDMCKKFNQYNLYDLEAFIHEQLNCAFYNMKCHGFVSRGQG